MPIHRSLTSSDTVSKQSTVSKAHKLLWIPEPLEMPPEVSAFRSASPEDMEEPSIENGLKMSGVDRKNSVAFKDPPGTSEHREKERQMIGRADQVYD